MKKYIRLITLTAIFVLLCAGSQTQAQKFVHITDLHVTTYVNGDAVGEFDQNGRNFQKLRDAIVAQAPAFVLATGDIVNTGLTDAGAADAANFAALTGKLWCTGTTPNIQWYMNSAKTIPIYFVPGNHDSRRRSQTPLAAQSLSAYDTYIGKPTTAPTYTAAPFGAIVKGTGETAYDYYFANSRMLVICLYSGLDATADLNVMNPEGAGLTAAQITFINTAKTAYPSRNVIIAMHHPAINPYTFTDNSNVGTTYDNKTFEGTFIHVLDGCISQKRTEFFTACASKAIVLCGHLHQNVVLDQSGVKKSYSNSNFTQASPTVANYIQTAEGFNGAYRVINVTSSTAYTVNAPSQASGLYSGVKTNMWFYYAKLLVCGSSGIIPIQTGGTLAPTQLKFYMDDVLQTTIANPSATVTVPYNVPVASTPSKIKVEVTNSTGTTTTIYPITKIDGTMSWYGRWAINDAHGIKSPSTGVSYNFKLIDIDVIANPKQAHLHILDAAGVIKDEMIVQMGIAKKTTFMPDVFILATLISNTVPIEIMVAPYIAPSLAILQPNANQTTGNCEVVVSTSYSGKNIPWMSSPVSPYVNDSYFKTLTFNGATSLIDTYTWVPPTPNGAKTMTVILTDKFSPASSISKSVTINFNSSLPQYAYRGPFGDAFKVATFWPSSGPSGNIKAQYCPDGLHYLGNGFMCSGRDHDAEVGMYADVLANATNSEVTSGVGVYVVDVTQYNTGSFSSPCGYGTITYKELYQSLANKLGRDASGKYRVWASTSALTRSSADAICIKPLLTGIIPTSNTTTTATSGGNVTDAGNATVTARGVCWNTTGSPTTADSKTVDGTGTGAYSSTLTGLTPNAFYYVRAYATNAGGTNYGSQYYFQSVPLGPAIDNENLVWSVSNYPWFPQTSTYYYGNDALQSSNLYASTQLSNLNTTIPYDGTLKFWWKMGGTGYFSYFQVWVDGSVQILFAQYKYGNFPTNWALFSMPVSAGQSVSIVAKGHSNYDVAYTGPTFAFVDQVEYNTTKSAVTNTTNGTAIDNVEIIQETMQQEGKANLNIYPNPFKSETTIEYSLVEDGDVNIAIYNITGQVVAVIANESSSAGTHTVVWNGKDAGGKELSSGMYYCRLTAGKVTRTTKLMLMKE